MDLDQVEFTLLPAPDDPGGVCHETAAKIVKIQERLRKRGVSVTSVIAHPTDDANMGQFVITLGPPAITAIAAIAGAWVQTRVGRRMRFKFDDVDAEVGTVQEIDGLFKRLTALRDSKRIAGEGRP